MNKKLLLEAILRSDIKSFICKVFDTINPGISISNAWYIDLMADYLEEVIKGKHKRLIINIPPRCLKSICISVALPAWMLGADPSKRIIVASYSQALSTKHSLDCRAIMQTKWYKELFPHTILSTTCNTKTKFMTSKYGFRLATSVGGSITGEGADILIVDDPHNPTFIHSDKLRTKTYNWFEQTFTSRLNDQNKGAIIVVMQRLHEKDLSSYLQKKQNWKLLKIPAISKHDQEFISSKKSYIFKKDTSIDPLRLPLTLLDKLKQEIGIANFKAQYLQEPEKATCGMLKKSEIKFYEDLPTFEAIYQSWDTAIKVNHSSDYSVCTTWGVYQNRYYLIDLLSDKLEYSYLKDAMIRLARKWQPKMILIEDKASGQSLIQDLKLANFHNILPKKPKTDKITRFASILPFFTLEQIFLPKESTWTSEIIQQITSFPDTTHDDIVDSISQFFIYIKQQQLSSFAPRLRSI